MDPAPASRRALWAYAGPFGSFVLLLVLKDLLPLRGPEFWVYPLQTLWCGAMLICFRREYPRAGGRTAAWWGAAAGLTAFVLWIAPQALFHASPRLDGFDPERILLAGGNELAYRTTVALRFVRLVIVVPLLEEIFWRGFLLRFLIREDFLSLPFGSWTLLSFAVVTAGFTLEHTARDWPAALVTGLLYNFVAVRTRSLPACVLAHALTNLLLGLYIMQTRQWGFW